MLSQLKFEAPWPGTSELVYFFLKKTNKDIKYIPSENKTH